MLSTNHGLSGMAIGALVPFPIAIPLAFASHFVMDTIPHYGTTHSSRDKRLNRNIVFIDSGIALSFAVISGLMGRWDMFWIGWVAYSPDLYWVYLYFKQGGKMNLVTKGRFGKFHKSIQREYNWGLLIELPIMFLLVILVTKILISSS